mgnify:CR=1 FL=1
MIKLLKSLLLLYILLLSGFLQYHGSVFYESISTFSVKRNQNSIIQPRLSNTKEKNRQNHIIDIEEKEKETVSFKKYLSFHNNTATPFYTQIAEYLFQYTQIFFPIFKHFSYYPFGKSLYLIFEVMRIWQGYLSRKTQFPFLPVCGNLLYPLP